MTDQQREELRTLLTKEWLLKSDIYCSDATGKKKETVKFPSQRFQVCPSEKTLDQLEQLLSQTRTDAIGECQQVPSLQVVQLSSDNKPDDNLAIAHQNMLRYRLDVEFERLKADGQKRSI